MVKIINKLKNQSKISLMNPKRPIYPKCGYMKWFDNNKKLIANA